MSEQTHRNCVICGENKPISDFPISKKVKNKTYYRKQCKTCYYSGYQKDQKNARKKLFIEYKKTCVCQICGYDDWRALQFHHINDKTSNVAGMVGRFNHKMVMEEIEKCICICANCHQIEHSLYDGNGMKKKHHRK